MYDFIGDIHGHADKLEALLEKMGYSKKDGVYQHSTRKAFFVGDYIDRGPKIREPLEIVRGMIENGFELEKIAKMLGKSQEEIIEMLKWFFAFTFLLMFDL